MRFILFFMLIICMTGCANGQQGSKIEIEINGIQDSVLYLVHYYGNSNMIADTAYREKSGKYIFSGKTSLPAGVYIVVDEKKSKSYFEFLLDGQQHFRIRTDTADIEKNLVFTNSSLNDNFREYTQYLIEARKEADKAKEALKLLKEDSLQDHQKEIVDLEKEIKDIDKRVKSFQQSMVARDPKSILAVLIKLQWDPEQPYDLEHGTREDSLNAYYYTRLHYWDEVDLSDERIVRTPIFYEKLKTYMAVLVVQHPDSVIKEGEWIIGQTIGSPDLFKFVVWYIVNMTERSNIMGMEKAFVHFAKAYYLAGKTWWANKAVLDKMAERVRILERILIGEVAPELQMWDTNKTVTSLHRVQAEYTILVFWDYECGHCGKMLPALLNYYHQVKPRGVEVFAVCTKTDLEKWKKYIREKGFDWINVNGGYSINRYDTLYDIMSTPIIFLLDKDKRILAKKLEFEQLKEFLKMEMDKAKNKDASDKEE